MLGSAGSVKVHSRSHVPSSATGIAGAASHGHGVDAGNPPQYSQVLAVNCAMVPAAVRSKSTVRPPPFVMVPE